jgi:plasmid stability protein
MPQILVRNVDKSTVDALKLRASRHRTSLQAEVKGILEAASSPLLADAATAAKRIQEKLRRRGAAFTDSGRSQAEDRRR